jgi:hypothetical protein
MHGIIAFGFFPFWKYDLRLPAAASEATCSMYPVRCPQILDFPPDKQSLAEAEKVKLWQITSSPASPPTAPVPDE